MAPRAAIALIFAAACTGLPPIDPGLCGNGVVEPGEDCDRHAPGAAQCGLRGKPNACFFVCGPGTADVCPENYRCGGDGRCRISTGEHSKTPVSWPFDVDRLIAGDADGDRFPDLIGHTDLSISVRYGEPGAGHGELRTAALHRPEGPLAFGHLDGDRGLDSVAPVGNGLFVLRGLPERSLAPVAYSPLDAVDGVSVRFVPVESAPLRTGDEILSFSGQLMVYGGLGTGVRLPVGRTADDIRGRIPIEDLDRAPGPGAGRSEFALPLAGAARVWIYTSTGSPILGDVSVVERQEVRLPAAIDDGVRFGDVDGDGARDLIATVTYLDEERLAIAYGDNARPGFFATTACLVNIAVPGHGKLGWPLALEDFDGDGRDDFVTPDGVLLGTLGKATCGDVPTAVRFVYVSRLRRWSAAVTGDFDGNGERDVAAIASDENDLEVLLGSDDGVFNEFHVRTSAPPSLLRAGDFDGDFVGDLAFVESGRGADEDELFVVFGNTSGGPSEPISMGKLGIIEHAEPLHAVAGLEAIDRITDLIVTSASFPDRRTRSAVIMYGTSGRRLIAPFTLETSSGRTESPIAAVTGNLCRPCADPTRDCPDTRDVAAIARPFGFRRGEALGAGQDRAAIWFLPGDPLGPPAAFDASSAARAVLPGLDELDVVCAMWTSGDVDGDGWDDVVGVDGSVVCANGPERSASRILVVRPRTPATSCGRTTISIERLPSSFTRIRDVELHDLDGDRDLDLLVAFAGRPNLVQQSESAAVVLWNEGGRISADSATAVRTPHTVGAVAPILLDGDAIPELLILGSERGPGTGVPSEGIYVARLDPETRSYGPAEQLVRGHGIEDLGVADLDGDGLDDIAWLEDRQVRIVYALPGGAEGAEHLERSE